MLEEGKTLSDYSIQKESTLHLVLRLRGVVLLYAAPEPSGGGNCNSRANPCSVEEAVAKANNEHANAVRIELAGGRYPLDDELEMSFGGSGGVTLEPESGATPILDGRDEVKVMSVRSSSAVTIDGLRLENGDGGAGGAILNSGRLTVEHSVLSDNTGRQASAIYNNNDATLTVENSTFSFNKAEFGGAIHSNGGDVTVIGSTIAHNVAEEVHGDGLRSYGGGITSYGGDFKVIGSTITDNQARDWGGGIYINLSPDETFTVARSTITGNRASEGAGIYSSNRGGTVTVEGSTITDNTGKDGAGLFTAEGDVTLACGHCRQAVLRRRLPFVWRGWVRRQGVQPRRRRDVRD